jgi:hypothetical protein
MTYVSRIPADGQYLAALGRAFYNFAYLESVIISTIARLSAVGHAAVPWGQTARFVARALLEAINAADPPLDAPSRRDLLRVHQDFRVAIKTRNRLLHSHPFTNAEGEQRLSAHHREWTMEEVEAAAQQFEEAALFANGVFHEELASRG